MPRRFSAAALWVVLGILLCAGGGCTSMDHAFETRRAHPGLQSAMHDSLVAMPAPAEPMVVAVYQFRDQTGQYETTRRGGSSFSRAVTQGGTSILIKALKDSDWFRPIERKGLFNLTQEGTGNGASVHQGGTGAYDNLAVLVQLGVANHTTIRQRGAHNLAGIRLEGSNNDVQLTQKGEGHEYLLDFTGSGLGARSSSQQHRVRQVGANNHLVQVGAGRMPFNVQQHGTGMRMIIRHTP